MISNLQRIFAPPWRKDLSPEEILLELWSWKGQEQGPLAKLNMLRLMPVYPEA